MTGRHGRYEALAGAILLGEATTAEREAYAAHAAGCLHCDEDLEGTRTLLSSAFVAAQHGETWRPFVRDEIDARIERRRFLSTRRITTLLSAAVAATLALNIALAVGVAPRNRKLALPATPPLSSAARPAGMSVAASLRTIAPPPKRRPAVARTRAKPVLEVGPSVPASEPALVPALPATLVTLPLSAETGARGRR